MLQSHLMGLKCTFFAISNSLLMQNAIIRDCVLLINIIHHINKETQLAFIKLRLFITL